MYNPCKIRSAWDDRYCNSSKNTLLLIDTNHRVLPIPITLSAVVKNPIRQVIAVTAEPKVSFRGKRLGSVRIQ